MKHELIDRNKKYPTKTGVYLMMNKKNQVIYIGKAKNLSSRIRSYFVKSNSLKNFFLIHQLHHIDCILTHTESEALLLEASLVKKHKPRYNVRLKDDKSYPYICVSVKDKFPRFYLERKVKKNKNIYFGPYTAGQTVRNMIRFLNEHYQIRDCSDGFMKVRKTPCLTYDIGHCQAPCVQQISQKEYAQQVKKAISFLRGSGVKVVKELYAEMKKQAFQENFERALILKKRAESIEEVWQKQFVLDKKTNTNVDVVTYYGDQNHLCFEILHIRSGRWIGHHSHFELEASWQTNKHQLEENFFSFLIQYYLKHLIPEEMIVTNLIRSSSLKTFQKALKFLSHQLVQVRHPKNNKEKKWIQLADKNSKNHLLSQIEQNQKFKEALLEIKKIFKLPSYPKRMECYDISHFQSNATYASQVVFENGLKKSSEYRLYKLKEINDDYQSMKSVLHRRFSHKEWPEPQLILVDGGKGQLHIAHQVLKECNMGCIPLVSIAKNKKKFSKNESDHFYQIGRKNAIRIRENQKSFRLLVQLRNEAHRFAISAHRKKLRTNSLESALIKIKGVGAKRKTTLLTHFQTVEEVKNARAEEIQTVLKVSSNLAKHIIESLKSIQ